MRKKILFINEWHNGDIHMSRPYVTDIMSFLPDYDFFYYHKNNSNILADIKDLTYTDKIIEADLTINTWIGQYYYSGRSDLYNGCNFHSLHMVMSEVYRENGWTDRLKGVSHYAPRINYDQLDTRLIDDFFSHNKRPSVLICNNEIRSGQSPSLDFPTIINNFALERPETNVFVTDKDPNILKLPNIYFASDFTRLERTGFDLNEISYLSTFTQLIFGRSSGPYSFSVVDENIISNRFICVTNDKRDSWYMPEKGYILWTSISDAPVLSRILSSEFDKAKDLKKQKNMFFGQFNPPVDFLIKEYFPAGYTGRCIEVGAVDGLFLSNTHHFELNGWDCLCIEPIPKYFDALQKNRKRAVQYAVSGQNSDQATFTIFTMSNQNQSSVSGLAVDSRLVEAHRAYSPKMESINVKTRRLDWIIENHFRGGIIDFISIDTEGNELDVLHSIDLDAHGVKLLIVENNYNDPEVENYLNKMGWIKDKRIEVNDFYLKGKIHG
jgi:FkbM family methyltransferase